MTDNYLIWGILGLIVLGLTGAVIFWGRKLFKPDQPKKYSYNSASRQPNVSQKSNSTSPANSSQLEIIRQIEYALNQIEENLQIKADNQLNVVYPIQQLNHQSNLESRLKTIQSRLVKITSASENPGQKLETRSFVSAAGALPDMDPEPQQDNRSSFGVRTISPPQSFDSEFLSFYNRARIDREKRNSFWGKFQVVQIGNRNASDQRLGRTTETDFQTADIGDFIAVEKPNSRNYLVVPNFTLPLDDTSYHYGGIAAAFNCDFTPGTSQINFQLRRPAEFVRNGEKWTLVSKGELILRS